MRQLLILALCVLAVFAQAPQKNCSAVPEPSATANYYMPPATCVSKDSSIKGCVDAFDLCIKAAKDCAAINTCAELRIFCLVQTTPASNETSCANWFSGLDNAGLYLMAGGSYKDSTLERACEWSLCSAAKKAFAQGVKAANGDVCPVNFGQVCTQPNFDPPTRAPTQVQYALTFGGAAWADVIANLGDKKSPEYKKFETAVAAGIAELLGVLPHYVTITEIKVGSLIVKFILNEAANVDVATVTTKLEAAKSDPALTKAAFKELATVLPADFAIEVTGVATEQPTPIPGSVPTPTPSANGTTPEPTPASAGLVSVAAAVVAVIAMMF